MNACLHLLPAKEKLLNNYRDPPSHLTYLFPINDDPKTIKEAVSKLKEYYFIYRLSNNYIVCRRPLPPAHWYAENNGINLPITDQNEANILLLKLEKQFIVNLPLGADWMDEKIVQ